MVRESMGWGWNPNNVLPLQVPTARMGNELIGAPMATANGVMHLTHAA